MLLHVLANTLPEHQPGKVVLEDFLRAGVPDAMVCILLYGMLA